MSEAVKYVLETFENVDKKCFKDFGFTHELVGSLLFNNFTLPSSCYPEAIYLMEKVGRRAFECKKGKLQINVNPEDFNGIKNMEDWKKDLLNWKV